MRRTEKDELEKLIMKALTPGVLTNGSFDLCNWICPLYVEELDDGLLLFKEKESCYVLNFWLGQNGSGDLLMRSDELFDLDKPVVCEIAFRAGDEKYAAATDFFGLMGFEKCVDRIRMSVKIEDIPWLRRIPKDDRIITADPSQIEGLRDFILSIYDPVTGCIPSQEELELFASRGEIYLVRGEDGRLEGIMQVQQNARDTELRHMAVRPDLRGKSMAQCLFNYTADCSDKKTIRVWVARSNSAAISMYIKNNFAADRWESVVLRKDRQE